eukprot:m.64230 g.64230  ORF g.64230 m.64230 type:complete len:416 (+) comp19532_c0_seq1:29-1276(+)
MLFLSFALLALFTPAVIGGGKTLVLYDNIAVKESHSLFFSHLTEKGFTLKYAAADASNLALIRYGELIFENLIIFAPSVSEFGGALSASAIAEYVDEGGNVLVAASSKIEGEIKDLASECGFEFDSEENVAVIDHVNSVDGDSTLIKAAGWIDASIITGDKPKDKSVLFRGVGMVADASNPLALDILTASSTAYNANPSAAIQDYPHAIGKSTVLVGGLQARNNARVVISGSLDLFSNDFFTRPNSANQQFAQNVALWAFQERGVLRAGVPAHSLSDGTVPREYTIGDVANYEVTIEEKVNGKWVGFSKKDVQLEFVRIDPFVRTFLENKNGKFTKTFKLPDVYGVFKFQVDYRRVGYTHIFVVSQVSVRPLLHTQYERFISSAYPYYASAFSMMAGLFLFSIVFLHHKEKPKLD